MRRISFLFPVHLTEARRKVGKYVEEKGRKKYLEGSLFKLDRKTISKNQV